MPNRNKTIKYELALTLLKKKETISLFMMLNACDAMNTLNMPHCLMTGGWVAGAFTFIGFQQKRHTLLKHIDSFQWNMIKFESKCSPT